MFFNCYQALFTGLLFFSFSVSGQNVFTETFSSDPLGAAQATLTNWDILYGDIDVGTYISGARSIDLGGDVNSSIQSKDMFTLSPGTYSFSFRAQDNTFRNSQLFVEIGTVFSQVYNAGATPQNYSATFEVTIETVVFIRLTEQGPNDNGGTFISNIQLDLIPILPVSLIYFKALACERGLCFEWHTASEINNKGFELQQSSNGIDWNTLDFIEGNHTTAVLSSYIYTAENNLREASYFRLKQVDHDGAYRYSPIVHIANEDKTIRIVQSGNHLVEILGVEKPELSLFNAKGILVKHLASAQSMSIEELPDGFYLLVISTEGALPKTVKVVRN